MLSVFFPRTMREISLLCVWLLLAAFAAGAISTYFYGLGQPLAVAFFAFASGCAVAFIYLVLQPQRVDPWALQRRLMSISGQRMPTRGQLDKNALMYYALIMEETGETLTAVSDALDLELRSTRGFPSNDSLMAVDASMLVFRNYGHLLQEAASGVRRELKKLDPSWSVEPIPLLVEKIADGLTDVVVVTAGAALATGVPGAECYEEVALSNLSKANPLTGLIDKDASGKWIKGSEYREPDLRGVLLACEAIDGPGC